MFSTELRNKIIWFLVLILIPFFSNAEQFSDNFDSYSTGQIQTVGSSNWITYFSGNGGSVSSGSSFSLPNYFVNNKSSNIPVCSTYDISSLDLFYVQFNLVGYNAVGYNIVLPSLFISSDCKYYSDGVHFQVMLNIRNDDHIWLYGRETRESTSHTYLYDTGYHYNDLNSITIEYDVANYNYRVFGAETISDYFPMYLSSGSYADDEVFSRFGFYNVSTAISSVMVDDVVLSETNPDIADGVCGADNDQQLNSIPVNLCSIGEATTVLSNPTGWTWECLPVNLGLIDYCSATRGENAIAGVCGADNGQILSNPPINFCNAGLLVLGSYSESPQGYTWQCSGTFSEIVENCSATKGTIFFPEPPDTEDCSGLSVLEGLVCEVKNLIASAFTPSSDAINRLNRSIYSIKNKAPFNYLYSFLNQVENISITETQSTNFCIMGHCGNIEIMNTIAENTKISFTFLFSLGFIFYLLNYIKRFFL